MSFLVCSRHLGAACAALFVLGHSVASARADPVADLAGRWSGWGSIVMAGGATEQVRCVVTYDVRGGGSEVRQGLRCASASYRVDAEAELRIVAGEVSGRWSERMYAAEGSVRGRAGDAGLNVTIEGPHFTAAMAVTTTGCKQAITIAPSGLDVTRVSIALSQC